MPNRKLYELSNFTNELTNDVSSGNVAATVYNIANLTTLSGTTVFNYTVQDNICRFSFYIQDVQPSGAGIPQFEIDPPVPSFFQFTYDAMGFGVRTNALSYFEGLRLTANPANDRLNVQWKFFSTAAVQFVNIVGLYRIR